MANMPEDYQFDATAYWNDPIKRKFVTTGRAQSKMGLIQNSILHQIAADKKSMKPLQVMPTGLFSSMEGKHLMLEKDNFPVPPTNTRQDREYLCLSITEYNAFANAIQTGAYLNREGNVCKVKNAKLKKLKNIRHQIIKSDYLMQSMIWKALLHIIEAEISIRQKTSRGLYG